MYGCHIDVDNILKSSISRVFLYEQKVEAVTNYHPMWPSIAGRFEASLAMFGDAVWESDGC